MSKASKEQIANVRLAQAKLDEKLLAKHPDSCVLDGIIDIPSYLNAPTRILWILKEFGAESGKIWDSRDYWRDPSGDQYSRWKIMAVPMIEVSFGILNGFPEHGIASSNLENKTGTLRQTAIININKLPGPQRTLQKRLQMAYNQFKEIIFEQIDFIDAEVIIGGNTLHLFDEALGIDRSKKDFSNPAVDSWELDGRLWLNAYHPAARKPTITHEEYYDSIINKVKFWKSS